MPYISIECNLKDMNTNLVKAVNTCGSRVGLDKLCQHNFENNRYSQEYENNAGIIGKAFCVIIT